MKRSSSLRTASVSLAVSLALLFSSCKKTTSPFTPPPPPLSSPCRLTDIESTIYALYTHYWIVYKKDGTLDSIYLAKSPGPRNSYLAYCKADPDGYVWYNLERSTDGIPQKSDFLYSSSITDSSHLPGSLVTSGSDIEHPAVEVTGPGYVFQYKANGRLDGYIETSHEAAAIRGALGIEYTADGDVLSLQFSIITGPKAQQIVTTYGFDGHPTPYAGIVGWVFRNPETGWGGAEFSALLYGLSDHNPLQWIFRDNDGKEMIRDDMTYEYNDHGQPTKRNVVRSNPQGGSMTYYEAFTYDCN